MTSLFVLVFGNYNESEDFEFDYKDKNEPINFLFRENVIELIFHVHRPETTKNIRFSVSEPETDRY